MTMNRLTREERHRLHARRQRAGRAIVPERPSVVTPSVPAPGARRRAARIVIAITLLGGAFVAFHAVEFHAPGSLIEMLLPRI
jgi:hypothetical protein